MNTKSYTTTATYSNLSEEAMAILVRPEIQEGILEYLNLEYQKIVRAHIGATLAAHGINPQ